ncbi:uncharacterized protein LOC144907279 isoform X1 [Branchiostoma floridae x Branchiostoma belcheri]
MAAFEHVFVLALVFVQYANVDSACTRDDADVLGFYLCNDKNLTTVPNALPRDTEKLDLTGNHIKTLLPNSFVNYPKLSLLFLSENGLETIHPDAFRGLTKLESLKLSDNLLRTFPCQALEHLPSLYTLKLDNNKINWIPSNCTFPSLKSLDLSNNQLESLPCKDDQSCFLVNMNTLNLQNNQLKTLPGTFCRFGEPTKLNLGGNPWRCDDSFLPLLSCKDVSSRIKCVMPSSVSSRILSTLSPDQLVRRSDANVTITGISTVSVGDTVKLQCNVQGISPDNITWGKIQKYGDAHFYPEGPNLLLTDVSEANAGVYICEVSIGNTKAWGNVKLEVLSVSTPPMPTTLAFTVQSSEVTTIVTTTDTTVGKNVTLNISMPEWFNTPSHREVGPSGIVGWQLIVIIFSAVFVALIITCLALTALKKLGWGNVDALPQYEGPIPIVVVDSPPASPLGGELVSMDEDQQYGSKQSLASNASYDKRIHNGDDELSDEVDHPAGSQGQSRRIQDERYPRPHLEDERKQLLDRRHSMGRRSIDSGASSRTSRNSKPKTPRRGERQYHSSIERVPKRRRDNGDNVSASTQSSSRSVPSPRRSRRRRKPKYVVPDVIVIDHEGSGEEDDIDGLGQVGAKKTIASERDLWRRWNPQRHSTSRRDVKSRAGGRAIATGRGAETFDPGNTTPPEVDMNDSFEMQDFSRARLPKMRTSQRSLPDGKRSAQRRPRRGREDADSGKGSSKEWPEAWLDVWRISTANPPKGRNTTSGTHV